MFFNKYQYPEFMGNKNDIILDIILEILLFISSQGAIMYSCSEFLITSGSHTRNLGLKGFHVL